MAEQKLCFYLQWTRIDCDVTVCDNREDVDSNLKFNYMVYSLC